MGETGVLRSCNVLSAISETTPLKIVPEMHRTNTICTRPDVVERNTVVQSQIRKSGYPEVKHPAVAKTILQAKTL